MLKSNSIAVLGASAAALALFPSTSFSQDVQTRKINLWFSAFIPDHHDGLADYILKTTSGKSVVRAPPFVPKIAGTCFSTDNRGFSNDSLASSRVRININLEINGVDMVLGKPVVRLVGDTHNVNCLTGVDLSPSKRASDATLIVGDVVKGDFTRSLYLDAASANPFFPSVLVPGTKMSLGLSPDIDFKISIRYEFMSERIVISGTAGYFPAFEGYYSIDGGAPKTLYQLAPYQDATAWSLIDLSTGLNTRNISATIDLN